MTTPRALAIRRTGEIFGRTDVMRTIPGYQPRPEQRRMAEEIAAALAEGGIALMEAGTGTGKSLAYLLPAVLAGSDQPVVISTATIQLQNQLEHKDIPGLSTLLQKAGTMNRPLRSVTLLGRNNFVSLRRAQRFLQEEQDDPIAERLQRWLDSTATGLLEEFDAQLHPTLAEKIASQSDNCLGQRCHNHRSCHYFNRRRAAGGADVVIVNHALLATELAMRGAHGSGNGILPPFHYLIVDEAHRLFDIAVDHLGASFSARSCRFQLQRLKAAPRRRGRKKTAPLRRIAESELLLTMFLEGTEAQLLVEDLRAIEEALLPMESALSRWESAMRVLVPDPGSERLRRQTDLHLRMIALSEPLMTEWGPLRAVADRVLKRLQPLLDHNDNPLLPLLLDLRSILMRLASYFSSLDRILWTPAEKAVQIATHSLHGAFSLAETPLTIHSFLAEHLWSTLDAGILTSATLKLGENCTLLRQELGLDASISVPERVTEHGFASPFDWQSQARLLVVSDGPDPNEASFGNWMVGKVHELAGMIPGRMFVLMTNAAQLRKLETELRLAVSKLGLCALVQGEDNRQNLVLRFKREPSVLFGLQSFWEGVDVPGPALQIVCIPRLPFPSPGDPWNEAYAELLEMQGENSFARFSLPRALLRFRQGAGRLLRSESDRGLIAVLDNRMVHKPYGRRFSQAIGMIPMLASHQADQNPLPDLAQWLRTEKSDG